MHTLPIMAITDNGVQHPDLANLAKIYFAVHTACDIAADNVLNTLLLTTGFGPIKHAKHRVLVV